MHLLNPYLPRTGYRHYHEPFLGAGALFFWLAPRKAFLSDLNPDLIDCYKAVRDNPELIYRYLQQHLAQNSEEHYYAARTVYNRSSASIAQGLPFIYLNKASFNGIFRVKVEGTDNAPYGHNNSPAVPSLDVLRSVNKALEAASITTGSYDLILTAENATAPGDFVYLDPPYPPLNGTAYFTHYTAERFVWRPTTASGHS